MEHAYETLFNVDSKSHTRIWKLNVVQLDDGVHIIRAYGVEDGKQTTVETIVTSGKNKGKSNETSPWEQATKQADALFEKQKLHYLHYLRIL